MYVGVVNERTDEGRFIDMGRILDSFTWCYCVWFCVCGFYNTRRITNSVQIKYNWTSRVDPPSKEGLHGFITNHTLFIHHGSSARNHTL